MCLTCRIPSAALLAALLLASPAQAQPGEADYARVNLALARDHAAPRYRALAGAAEAFDRAVQGLCRATPPRDLGPARQGFHAVADAWADVEHIRHGPVETLMRNFRIYFWPDRNGRGARQLRLLLSRRDRAALAPERFASASVAVQGLPAAEMLLFSDDSARRIADGSNGDYACALLEAVARNLVALTGGLSAEWNGGARDFVDQLRNPGRPEAAFASHRDATAAFVKDLYTSLQAITDFKLDRVLGASAAEARPRRAELWRSGRSLATVVRNLEALRAMYEGNGGAGLRALLPAAEHVLGDLVSMGFAQTLEAARAVGAPLDRAVVDPVARRRVVTLARRVRALEELIGGRLAPALAVPLGFNALDGD